MSIVPVGQVLTPFGFTGLESEIYAMLLRESPATGYRIAQAINKPVANTYKAIQSLAAKGAIVVDDSGSRQCRAVPADELLGRISQQFQRQKSIAETAFRELDATPSDDRIYALRSTEQALQRARTMLTEAKSTAFLGSDAGLLAGLRGSIEAAVAVGVAVHVRASAPLEFDGGQAVVVELPGVDVELVVAVDGISSLRIGVHASEAAGYWTRQPYIARADFRALAAEHALAEIAQRIEEGAGAKRIARVIKDIPGVG